MGAAAPLMGLAGTAASMGGGIMDMQGRKKAHQQQVDNVNKWYMNQALLRAQEMNRQELLREQADKARNIALDQVSSTGQMAQQAGEEGRLNNVYALGTSSTYAPATAGSVQAGSQPGILTGQSGGGDQFRTDLARRLNNRTQDAKNRIQALATMGSYGDSKGGLGTVNPLAFQQSGWDINAANNFRQGSLQAYGVERKIQPEQVQYNGSPGAMALQSIGGLMSGMGKGGGGDMSGGGLFG